jgi:hypothetical protein
MLPVDAISFRAASNAGLRLNWESDGAAGVGRGSVGNSALEIALPRFAIPVVILFSVLTGSDKSAAEDTVFRDCLGIGAADGSFVLRRVGRYTAGSIEEGNPR